MGLFDRFITWLAVGLSTRTIRPTDHRMYRGKPLSRVHAVQLKRQKSNNRLRRWWRWWNR